MDSAGFGGKLETGRGILEEMLRPPPHSTETKTKKKGA